ncbi:shikimate kinase [Robertkochia sediminum]|uniref:shikimate kinase n=1 Tax=Robertkochia sediminum TaxID=2785326 RepID=UPI00193454CE|nr:shikimate kinase [Robertkochia sediminum]MBL7472517.1 AAA family ATPase [Robertkochia sediminum]
MIVLLGYMGSGKSTAGKELAELLKVQFIDFDDFIEEKEQKTITEIFQQKGEVYFRKKERMYLQELLQSKPNAVIALGGGTPCFGDNMQLLLESDAKVVYLKAKIDTLTKRLMAGKSHRPIISHLPDSDLEEFVRKHLFERNFFYLQAPVKIDVDELSTEEVVARLRALM